MTGYRAGAGVAGDTSNWFLWSEWPDILAPLLWDGRPGHFVDSDFIANNALTNMPQNRALAGFAAIIGSPMIISVLGVPYIDANDTAILYQNKELIAVDQDPLVSGSMQVWTNPVTVTTHTNINGIINGQTGHPNTLVTNAQSEVFYKPMADGTFCVYVVNLGTNSYTHYTSLTNFPPCLSDSRYGTNSVLLHSVFDHTNVVVTGGGWTDVLAPCDARFYRVYPVTARVWPCQTNYLSDYTYCTASSNWFNSSISFYNHSAYNAVLGPIAIGGTNYEKGFGMQIGSTPGNVSKVFYDLNGESSMLHFIVACDDAAVGVESGSAELDVYGDGVLLAASSVFNKTSAAQEFNVNVAGVHMLEFRLYPSGGSCNLVVDLGNVFTIPAVPAASVVGLSTSPFPPFSANHNWVTVGAGDWTGANAGTGSVTTRKRNVTINTGTTANSYASVRWGISSDIPMGISAGGSGSVGSAINWSKPFWFSVQFDIWNGTMSANGLFKCSMGNLQTVSTNTTAASPGVSFTVHGATAPPYSVDVTRVNASLTATTSTSVATLPAGGQDNISANVVVYSDGVGNVTLWVNNAKVGTYAGGPTGMQDQKCELICEVQNGSDAAANTVYVFGAAEMWGE
jgi:hypothetical protein